MLCSNILWFLNTVSEMNVELSAKVQFDNAFKIEATGSLCCQVIFLQVSFKAYEAASSMF